MKYSKNKMNLCFLFLFFQLLSDLFCPLFVCHLSFMRFTDGSSFLFSGIAMLTFALLMSARMGIFQETLYKKYGKHSKEALFYNVRLLTSFVLFISLNY